MKWQTQLILMNIVMQTSILDRHLTRGEAKEKVIVMVRQNQVIYGICGDQLNYAAGN